MPYEKSAGIRVRGSIPRHLYEVIMSRTRRIYNRIIKKAHRINLLTQPGMSLEKQVETGEINNPLRNSIHQYGLVYHPFASWLCMGKCPCCRNHDLDPRHQRKVRQREFARVFLNRIVVKKIFIGKEVTKYIFVRPVEKNLLSLIVKTNMVGVNIVLQNV